MVFKKEKSHFSAKTSPIKIACPCGCGHVFCLDFGQTRDDIWHLQVEKSDWRSWLKKIVSLVRPAPSIQVTMSTEPSRALRNGSPPTSLPYQPDAPPWMRIWKK